MVVYVDCRPLEQHGRSYRVDDDVSEAVGSYQKYLQRSEIHEEITYLDYLQSYNLKTWRRLRVNAKQRVLSYFPRYQPVEASSQFHDFCRVKLMLSHPHRRRGSGLTPSPQRTNSAGRDAIPIRTIITVKWEAPSPKQRRTSVNGRFTKSLLWTKIGMI